MRIHITEILLFFSFTVEKSKKLLNTEKACWEIRITRVLNQGQKGRNLLLLNSSSPFLPFNTPFNTHSPEYCWQMQLMKKKKILNIFLFFNIKYSVGISYIPWMTQPSTNNLSVARCLKDVIWFVCMSIAEGEVKKKHLQTQGSPD